MKTLIATALTLVSISAQAELFEMGVRCEETKVFLDFFDEYNMKPIYYSDNSQILNNDGSKIPGELSVWANKKGDFGTLFTVPESGKSCLTSASEDTIKFDDAI
jgi:hypothetical protein